LWDVETGKFRSTFKQAGVDCVAFSGDGKTLAAGGLVNVRKDPRVVKLWDAASGKELHSIVHESRILCLAFSADSQVVATGSEGGELRLWDVATGKERASLPQTSYVHAVAFAPDGKSLAAATHDGVVRLWDLSQVLKPKPK